ncbi:MAG: hypothetical protein ACR2N7_08440 [Acidimicrobiia bacterium]
MSSPEMGDAAQSSLKDACEVIALEATEIFFVALLVLGVAVIAGAAFAFRHRPDGSERTDAPNAWQKQAGKVCAAGREVIDLTTAHDPDERGLGLSIHELGEIETKLDLLVGKVRDVQPTAPNFEASHQLGLVAEHASSLNAVVQTERRVRLSTLDLKGQQLDTIILEFISERSALDDVLVEMSKELGPTT